MANEVWQERLNQSQAENVSLIINGFTILFLFCMALLAKWNLVVTYNGNLFVLIGVLVFSIKTIALMYIEREPYPFIFAILMLALGLMFLSQRYLLGTALIVTLAWTGVALVSLSQLQMVSTLLALIVGSAMGMFLLERRIQAHVHLYELEKKVENLETILPMCANCKQTRDEEGNLTSVEAYIESKKGLQITHGVCPACTQLLYGDLLSKAENRAKAAG